MTENAIGHDDAAGGGFEENVGGAPSTSTSLNKSDPYQSIAYLEALDDIDSRFILNLPDSEIASADRIFVQLEQAWWFYEDLLCDPRPDLNLPRFATLKPFARALFDYSPRLPDASHHFSEMWNQYIQYKRKISNYGCILLSSNYQKIVLCQVYNSKSYTLPAGKINQGEDGPAAAARETYEETGFDPSCRAGSTADWLKRLPHLITWNRDFVEADMLTYQDGDKRNNGKHRTSFIVAGVPEDFPFAPVCRKEVSNIEWFSLDSLPADTFAVLPFVRPLREWIRQKKQGAKTKERGDKSRERGKKAGASLTTSTSKRHGTSVSRGRSSRGRGVAIGTEEHDQLLATGLVGSAGDAAGWSEEDMFATNERLLNRKVEYDGNPHVFVEEGLTITDPHAYRIVGGSLLNSKSAAGTTQPLPPPPPSQLQPLVRQKSCDVDVLTPFFSPDGVSPWGDVVADAKSDRLLLPTGGSSTSAKTKKKTKSRAAEEIPVIESTTGNAVSLSDDTSHFLPTDAQITAQSQAIKLSQVPSLSVSNTAQRQYLQQQHDSNTTFIQEWVTRLPMPVALLDKVAILRYIKQTQQRGVVATSSDPQPDSMDHHIQQWLNKLPRTRPNKYFGSFRLDAEAIMAQAQQDVSALSR